MKNKIHHCFRALSFLIVLLIVCAASNGENPENKTISDEVSAIMVWRKKSMRYEIIIKNEGSETIYINSLSYQINANNSPAEDNIVGISAPIAVKKGLSALLNFTIDPRNRGMQGLPTVAKFDLSITSGSSKVNHRVKTCNIYICES